MRAGRGGNRNLPDVNTVKTALMRYTKEDRYNKNSSYNLGLNSQAQNVIYGVSQGDGFASKVAQTIVKNNYRSITEKQAYIIAKEAVDSKSKWLYDKKGKLNVIFEKAPKYGTPEYYEWLYGE